MHIAIAGNIGSGKTTLTTLLARHYGWEPRFEQVDFNPYLEDYYRDIPRWSFNMEVFFLKERFKDLLKIAKTDHTVIQDRSIYEGVYVFVANNKEQGNLSDRDFETYMELFEDMLEVVKYPELMIYLRASVPHLVPIEYLEGLKERYEDFLYHKYDGKLLVVDVDNMDFQHNPKDFGTIIDRIDAQLFGLF